MVVIYNYIVMKSLIGRNNNNINFGKNGEQVTIKESNVFCKLYLHLDWLSRLPHYTIFF